MNAKLNLQFAVYMLALVEHARNQQRLLTESEVAYLFSVSPNTVRNWRLAGLIGHYTFEGGDVRYSQSHIQQRMIVCERQAA